MVVRQRLRELRQWWFTTLLFALAGRGWDAVARNDN
jgi:hypothetical protein